MEVYAEDARPWLERSDGGYDAIMVDAYRQPYIPFYLATARVLRADPRPARARAASRSSTSATPRATTSSSGCSADHGQPPSRASCATRSRTTNTLLVGGEGAFSAARLTPRRGGAAGELRPLALEAAAALRPRLPGGEVFTDDHAPVEWLVDSSLLEYANE